MKYGIYGLLAGLIFIVGCGGSGDRRHQLNFGITEMQGVNYGVSVEAYESGSTNFDSECRDDHSETWCDTTSQHSLKEVRWWSNDESTSYEWYDVFIKNSDSGTGPVRVHLETGGYEAVDRVITLNPGQKIRVGSVNRDGDFYGANGF